MPNHIVNTIRFEDGKQSEYLKMLHELRVPGSEWFPPLFV